MANASAIQQLLSGDIRLGSPSTSSLPHLPPDWCLKTLVGRLTELSGDAKGANLSATIQLIHDAQQQHEPVVWISRMLEKLWSRLGKS